MPSAVCVRSLVPKLKNSAVSAISSAVSAPRGTSIIVPTRYLSFTFFSACTSFGDAVDDLDLQIELLLEADQRNHDFGLDLDAFLLHDRRRFEDGAGLHLGDLGIDDAQAAAAEAEHRVELVQLLDALVDRLGRRRRASSPSSACCSGVVRQELVQRRIEEADRRRVALQRPEDAGEVVALVRQQLGERLLPVVERSRRGSSRASRRCGRLRRTCARCGTGRCLRRRTRRRSAVCSGVSALVRT